MKTIIYSQFIIVIVLIFTFNACNESGVADNLGEKGKIGVNDQFEQTLLQIFDLAGDRLQSFDGVNPKLDEIFRDAYVEVLQDEARVDIFRASVENVAQSLAKSGREMIAVFAVNDTDSPEKVLSRIENMLGDDELDESSIIDLISLRQTILFLMDNYKYLESVIAPYSKLNINETANSDDGWWEQWGRCAAGTIGGAGLGALTGCGVGVVAAVGVGCSAGAVIGGVSGALKGASSTC